MILDVYVCQACGQRYAIGAGTPIRCRSCYSKSREHVGQIDVLSELNYLLNTTPEMAETWRQNTRGPDTGSREDADALVRSAGPVDAE